MINLCLDLLICVYENVAIPKATIRSHCRNKEASFLASNQYWKILNFVFSESRIKQCYGDNRQFRKINLKHPHQIMYLLYFVTICMQQCSIKLCDHKNLHSKLKMKCWHNFLIFFFASNIITCHIRIMMRKIIIMVNER